MTDSEYRKFIKVIFEYIALLTKDASRASSIAWIHGLDVLKRMLKKAKN